MYDLKRIKQIQVPAVLRTRQAIRLIRLALMVFLVINVIYFSLFKQSGPVLLNTNPRQKYQDYIARLFTKITQDPDRFHMANTGLTEVDIKVPIKKFMNKFENEPESLTNQDMLYYDPRFTIAMYLNEIKHRYVKAGGNSKKVDSNRVEEITLPFNWVDWMDMAIL
ncbi:uncharacterized protein SPAPADRAFT_63440, partial [Spathaspora passalidarum NRRL Y-27907]